MVKVFPDQNKDAPNMCDGRVSAVSIFYLNAIVICDPIWNAEVTIREMVPKSAIKEDQYIFGVAQSVTGTLYHEMAHLVGLRRYGNLYDRKSFLRIQFLNSERSFGY